MPDYDLIIAGYGPTGAVAANLLGAQGFSVLALDLSPEIYNIPRAVHIDGEVMRIFQVLGLASEIDEGASEGAYLRFINGWNWRLFSQDMSQISRPNGWANDIFFNQPRMEQILRAGVQRYANVEVRLGWALQELSQDAHGVVAGLRQVVGEGPLQRVRCRYLLACDGASSKARELLDIAQEDLQCDEPWLVCDLILEEDVQHRRDAYQICDPVRPTTLAPCEGQHIRCEFMLNANDEVAELEHEATVRTMMAPHLHLLSPSLNSASGKLIRSKVYNFHAVIAESFQTDGVFLLGDAAHQMPPFLGQGLCAGVRDAYNLCWKLGGGDPWRIPAWPARHVHH